MKPKDLPYPYKWEERYPFLKEKIFYVPKYFRKHRRKLFPNLEEYFENAHPVYIEYCSGNGEWILNRAQKWPSVNWIAVEMCFERVRKIYSKMINYKIDNLLIVYGEGITFSKKYLSDRCLDKVYVNFPDPWPKNRHAKHRIIQRPFVEELRRILKKEGTVTLVTDHVPYKKQMECEMQEWSKIKTSFENYGSSFFERLWRSYDLKIHYLCYANY